MATAYESAHESCRGKVCVVCYEKASRSLSAGDIETIRDHIIEGYSTLDSDFPNGICTHCSLSLSQKRKTPEFVIPNRTEDYNANRKPGLRSKTLCSCRICNVAKLSGLAFLQYKRKNRKKPGRPSSSSKTPENFKICGKCLSKLYRGCNHSSTQCQQSRRSKVESILEITSPSSLHRAANRINSNSAAESPVTPLGRPKKLNDVKKKELFTSESIFGIAQDLQLSAIQTKTLAQDIRMASGSRKAVEKNAMETVRKRNHQVDGYFEVRNLVYRRRKDKESKLMENFEQKTIVCNDVSGFIETILERRGRESGEDILVKISVDGGGGFLKVCLSIFDKDDPFPHINSALSKKFKESGVKKVFLLAVVPDVPESYVNVKRIWINLNLVGLERSYTIATDLKLCNILLGMMSHSSCHPCCWCDISKENLNKKGEPRSISSLSNLFWNYFEAGVGVEEAKKFGNVVHQPMISDDQADTTPVIRYIPPPELHLMTGPFNTMFKGLEGIWPGSDAWLRVNNVKKTEYHGGCFTGNDCWKLLKKADVLLDMAPNDSVKRYGEAFQTFNAVVEACYGDNLAVDYNVKIKKFAAAYSKLKLSITPKVHAVVFHIEEFCSMTGRGLAPWGEQTGEAVHHDFLKTWERFRVKLVENPVYGDYLLQAVRTYNGQHV